MYISTPFEIEAPCSGVEAQFQRVVHDLGSLLADRELQMQRLTAAHHQTLLLLALAAESRDGDTGVHIVRLGQIAGLLALTLTGNRAYATDLCKAAPMHDIGKIGVPDAVLKKCGHLSDADWQVMRQHPLIGAQILGSVDHPLMRLAADVALHHHERFDGTGYPHGLAGADISQAARIVSLADFYDALTMDRVYRPRLAHDEVCSMIAERAGTHFDPDVAAAFAACASRASDLREEVNERFAHRTLQQEGVDAFLPMF